MEKWYGIMACLARANSVSGACSEEGIYYLHDRNRGVLVTKDKKQFFQLVSNLPNAKELLRQLQKQEDSYLLTRASNEKSYILCNDGKGNLAVEIITREWSPIWHIKLPYAVLYEKFSWAIDALSVGNAVVTVSTETGHQAFKTTVNHQLLNNQWGSMRNGEWVRLMAKCQERVDIGTLVLPNLDSENVCFVNVPVTDIVSIVAY